MTSPTPASPAPGSGPRPGLVCTWRFASLSSRAATLYTLHTAGCARIGAAETKPLAAFPERGLPLLTRVRAGLNAKACAYCKPSTDDGDDSGGGGPA